MSGSQIEQATIERSLRRFVVENFLFSQEESFSDEASFIQMGILDSTGVLELVAFVESTFDIEVEDHELSPENLDSIRNLAAFVRRKLPI